jgi:hypothetical protein
MGFNIQQYELNNNEEFSNGSGKIKDMFKNVGTKLGIGDGKVLGIGQGNVSSSLGIGSGNIKAALGIGDGKIFGKVVNPTKNAEYKASKNIPNSQEVTEVPKTAPSSITPEVEKSNVGLYIGIGVGVLAIGIVTIVLLTRKK